MKNKNFLVSTVFISFLLLISSTVSAVSAQSSLPESNYSYVMLGNSGNGTISVQFTDLSENATKLNWDFGDRNNSTEQNPLHTFSSAGNYTINLTASNEKGLESKLVTINVSEKSVTNRTDIPIIMINESGIPTVDYGYVDGVYVGKQLNPVTISNIALFYESEYRKGNESCKQLFLNNSNYLVENAVLHENYSMWQYNFSWPIYNLTNPWISGMAQGRAVHVLIRAYNMTDDEKYLDSARLALNSFHREAKNGGVTYKDQKGWWYEEYVTGRDLEPRVLNGMVFALLGIYEYYKFTRDQDAKFLFDQGILSLKNDLYKFDSGNWSYYDVLGNKASLSYHKLHIKQMLQLYEITKDPIFKEYHEKFQRYYEDSMNSTKI